MKEKGKVSMNEPTAAEVKQAVQALKINKPIMKVTKRGKTLTFYLYGGQVLKYRLRPVPA
jgi:hypothetical protein